MSWREAPDSQADGWKQPAARLDLSAAEILAQIERLDYVYDVMAKEYEKILESLRHPWRISK